MRNANVPHSEDNVENELENSRQWLWLFAGALVVSIVVTGLYGFAVYYAFETPTDRGTFGDMFGGINAVFAGLGFFGVIYAIWQQQKQIAMQKQDLDLALQESRKSAEAQKASAEALEKQLQIAALTTRLQAKMAQWNAVAEAMNPGIPRELGLAFTDIRADEQIIEKLQQKERLPDAMRRQLVKFEELTRQIENLNDELDAFGTE